MSGTIDLEIFGRPAETCRVISKEEWFEAIAAAKAGWEERRLEAHGRGERLEKSLSTSSSVALTEDEVSVDPEGWEVVERNTWQVLRINREDIGARVTATRWVASGFGVESTSTRSPEAAIRNGRAKLRKGQKR